MTTTLRDWLASRSPAPPAAVGRAVSESVEEDGAVTPEALMDPAVRHLEQAAAHTGRHRESAFTLLTADALVTYAAEAALELDDPDRALSAMTERLSTP